MLKTKLSALIAGLFLVSGVAIADTKLVEVNKGPVTLGQLSAKQAEVAGLELDAKIAKLKAEIAKSSESGLPTSLSGVPLMTNPVSSAKPIVIDDELTLQAVYGKKGSLIADVEANGTLLALTKGSTWQGWTVTKVEPEPNARVVLVKGNKSKDIRFTSAPAVQSNSQVANNNSFNGLPPMPNNFNTFPGRGQ